ncbi:MAG TPA: sucrase ferredoxin [Gaiellaceae bacterium]|nr:sucrase ferredoxin [Gaiellaceae bacterium]
MSRRKASLAPGRRFCSDDSREHGESLAATASRVDHWILIEYHGAWERDAVDSSGLTTDVKAHLVRRAFALRPAKVLFIRRRERRASDGIHVYWASSRERRTTLSATIVDAYTDLLGLYFDEPGEAPGHPLLLACTHGKHDACCARYGLPLYEAMRELVDEGWVWQCSHVGGDRFAGNLVCLPEGAYYGRVRAGDARAVLDEHLAGRVHLGFYRGRSSYSFPVQAAERAVREASGMLGLADLELRSTSPIRFRAGATEYEVEVVRHQGDFAHLTCDAAVLSRPWRYAARILRESDA